MSSQQEHLQQFTFDFLQFFSFTKVFFMTHIHSYTNTHKPSMLYLIRRRIACEKHRKKIRKRSREKKTWKKYVCVKVVIKNITCIHLIEMVRRRTKLGCGYTCERHQNLFLWLVFKWEVSHSNDLLVFR